MSDRTISLDGLTLEQQRQFKVLTGTPAIAWLTVAMWVVLTAVFLSCDILGASGRIPLWLGMLLNSVVGYLAFSVVHDSLHRAISTNTKLNDWIGQLAIVLVAPYVSLKLFRWGHILHHRFANGPRDPDRALHGPWWQLPLRWLFIDVVYLMYAIRHGDKVSRPFLIESYWSAALFASVLAGLTVLGYGQEVLMEWFIPSRLIFLTLGFSFFLAAARSARYRAGEGFHPGNHHPRGRGVVHGSGVAEPEFPPHSPFVPNDAVLQQSQGLVLVGDGAAQEGSGDPAQFCHPADNPPGWVRRARHCISRS